MRSRPNSSNRKTSAALIMMPWRVHGDHHKHSKDTETEFFEPREDPDKRTSIVVKVSYNRAQDVQRYFRWNFLTPQDNVTSWKLQSASQAKNSQHRFSSRVALTLGSERTPPKYKSKARWDSHMDAVQSQLTFWMQWIHNLESTKEEAKTEHHKNPKKEEIVASYDEPLKLLEIEKDSTAIELRDLIGYRPNVQAHQEFDMICDVIKAKTYCYLCATLDHSLDECETRGCTICGAKDHPHYKCPEQCDCKMRPFHVKTECPQIAARSGPEQPVVSLRRLQKTQQAQQTENTQQTQTEQVPQQSSESRAIPEEVQRDVEKQERVHQGMESTEKGDSLENVGNGISGDIFANGDFGNERDPFLDVKLSDLQQSLQRSLGL